MKRISAALLLLLCSLMVQAQGQNLVPNPSFEDYNACPQQLSAVLSQNSSTGIAYSASYTQFPTVKDWVSPSAGSPDYFNSCAPANIYIPGFGGWVQPASVHVPDNFAGYQYAHTGQAYAGFYACAINALGAADRYQMPPTPNTTWTSGIAYNLGAEYLETKLSQPLRAGHHYNIHFYTNYASYSGPINKIGYFANTIAVDQVGAYVSTSQLNQYAAAYYSLTPQVVSTPGLIITDTAHWLKVDGAFQAAGGEQWLTLGRFYDSASFSVKLLNNFDTSWDPTLPQGVGLTQHWQFAYYYVDDICVLDLDSPIVSHTDTALLCRQSQPVAFSAARDSMQLYQWSTGDTGRTITIKDTGTYWVRSLGKCSVYVDTVHIRYLQLLPLALGNDTNYCLGSAAILSANHNYAAYQWSTGDTTDAITVLQAGNYWLTVTDICGLRQTDSIRLTFNATTPKPEVNDTAICQYAASPILNVVGDSLKWYTTEGGTGTTQQPAINTDTIGKVTTLYVSQTGICGESDKAAIKVQIENIPKVELFGDSVFCEGESTQIRAVVSNPASYLWNTGEKGDSITIRSAGTYIVQASITLCGISADTMSVRTQNCNQSCLWLPSAFSPNADGKNDIFRPITICAVSLYHMIIVNRWGQNMFETYSIDHGWDGTFNGRPVDIGVYYYRMESSIILGEKYFVKKGDVTLIR